MALLLESWLIEAAGLLTILSAIMYYYFTATFDHWKNKGIPFPKDPEFFFGNVKDMFTQKKSQVDAFDEMYYEFKDKGLGYGGFYQLREPVLMLTSPEAIKEFTISSFATFHERGFVNAEFDPMSRNLAFIGGNEWKFLRAKMTQTFTTNKLKMMMPLIQEATDGIMKTLEGLADSNKDEDFYPLFYALTTDVITSVAYGYKLDTVNTNFREWAQKVSNHFGSTWRRLFQLITQSFPFIYKLFRMKTVPTDIADFFIATFKETAAERKSLNVVRNDFMQSLMTLREIKVTKMQNLYGEDITDIKGYDTTVSESMLDLTDEILAAQAFLFFTAGFETTALALTHALMLLSENPDVYQKLIDEVDEVIERHGVLNFEAIQDLKYLDQVINETLRLYPSLPMIVRKNTNRSFKLPGTDSYLDKGTRVFIPTYNIQSDPEYWPNPRAFDPERFSEENKHNIVPHTFHPFGEGPRICIGMRFAMLEMKTVLATFAQKYKFVPGPRTKPFEINKKSFMMKSSSGIYLNVIRRT